MIALIIICCTNNSFLQESFTIVTGELSLCKKLSLMYYKEKLSNWGKMFWCSTTLKLSLALQRMRNIYLNQLKICFTVEIYEEKTNDRSWALLYSLRWDNPQEANTFILFSSQRIFIILLLSTLQRISFNKKASKLTSSIVHKFAEPTWAFPISIFLYSENFCTCLVSICFNCERCFENLFKFFPICFHTKTFQIANDKSRRENQFFNSF